jgi:hypothetical protein
LNISKTENDQIEPRTTSASGNQTPPNIFPSALTENPREPEGLRNEYTQVNEFIRHYATLRFAIMTVYLAAMGGLIAVAFGFFETKTGNPDHLKLWGRLGGLLTTALFFIYETRVQSLINFRLKIGKKLEEEMGYTHLKSRPSWAVLGLTISRLPFMSF